MHCYGCKKLRLDEENNRYVCHNTGEIKLENVSLLSVEEQIKAMTFEEDNECRFFSRWSMSFYCGDCANRFNNENSTCPRVNDGTLYLMPYKCEKFVRKEGIPKMDNEICECCGSEIVKEDNVDYIYIENDDVYFCNAECAHNKNYFECENCGEWAEAEYTADNGMTFCCYDCMENADYHACECCGDIYHDDYMHWDDNNDEWRCDDCYEPDEVNNYHDNYNNGSYSFEFKGDTKNGELPRVAVEYEMDFGYRSDFIRHFNDTYSNDTFIATLDASLTRDSGIECITTAMTFEEFYKQDFFGKFCELARSYEYESYNYDEGECGQHINLSFENENMAKIGVKMLRIMQRFTDIVSRYDFCKRRHWSYCEFNTHNVISPDVVMKQYNGTIDNANICNDIARDENAHSLVVNLTHVNNEYNHKADRIELRLFGGTMDEDEVLQRLAFVQGLALVCKNKDVQFIEWCSWEQLKEEIYSQLKNVDKNAYFVCKSWLSAF